MNRNKMLKQLQYILIVLSLINTIIVITGCASGPPTPNPVAGWQPDSLNNLAANKTIKADYNNYISKIPRSKMDFTPGLGFSQSASGEHAVSIETGSGGTWWMHILIYDINNVRIKTIVYKTGDYRS